VAPPGEKTFFSKRGLAFSLRRDWSDLKELADRAGAHYRSFDEWQGGKWRHFDVPSQRLADVQSEIARLIKARIDFPPTMLGGIKGRSPRDNAEIHAGQGLVFKIDIRDCFPSIDNKRVFRMFRNRLGFSDSIANILTRLTTFQRRLPQGSPTSTLIANAVLIPLHDDMQVACRPINVGCSFWVDDITLSGNRVRDAIEPVLALVRKHGFSMRARKVCLLAAHRTRQSVTGVVVNRRQLSVGRERRNKLRSQIHRLAVSGHTSKAQLTSIRSSIAQINHISKSQGATLAKLARLKLPSEVSQAEQRRATKLRIKCRCTHKHRLIKSKST
jgi:hypothetical protein